MINLPLMQNNITRSDLDVLIEFLKGDPVLTHSKNVKAFEEEWSAWVGVKHSVMVNSGATANFITMGILREIYGDGEIITPPLTWVSDVVSVIRNDFTPVFVDINPRTLCMDTDGIIARLTPRTRAVFLTHILGFNGLTEKLLAALADRRIHLIEDVCESHGATFKGKKLGAFGYISNFSFYYAHHLSTIEGGMICTNDEKIYQMARIFRSHGMVREATDEAVKAGYVKDHPEVNPEFIFAYPSLNFRSTEINAVIGRNQLKRLDDNNRQRRENFDLFLKNLDSAKYVTDFDTEGSCNYAFVLVLKKSDPAFCSRVMEAMRKEKVEFRRGTSGGGNQLKQPYLKKYLGRDISRDFPRLEHVHFYGFYLGNFPGLQREKILQLCEVLNRVS